MEDMRSRCIKFVIICNLKLFQTKTFIKMYAAQFILDDNHRKELITRTNLFRICPSVLPFSLEIF